MLSKLLKFHSSQDKIYFYSTFASILLVLLTISFIFYSLSNLPRQVPLFYSLAWGKEQLRSIPQLFVLPLLSILIMVINILLAMQLHPSQIILKRIIYISFLITSLMLAITCFKIITIYL